MTRGLTQQEAPEYVRRRVRARQRREVGVGHVVLAPRELDAQERAALPGRGRARADRDEPGHEALGVLRACFGVGWVARSSDTRDPPVGAHTRRLARIHHPPSLPPPPASPPPTSAIGTRGPNSFDVLLSLVFACDACGEGREACVSRIAQIASIARSPLARLAQRGCHLLIGGG